MTRHVRGPLRVLHLIPGAITHHSPTSAIAAQIKHHDRARVASEVLSFYAAPAGRSPARMFEELEAPYTVLASARDPFDSRALAPLVRHLRRTRPTVLHCHFVRANLYGRIAARLTGVPVVINTLHSIDDYTRGATLSSRLVRLVERSTLSLVSRYVAVSEAVRRHAIATIGMSPGRIVTILNALEPGPFEHGATDREETRSSLKLNDDAVVLASIGNLIPLKNHSLAIRMVHQLRQRMQRDVQLLIAGDGPDREKLERLVAELRLGDAVRILGLRRDVPRLLAATDIFVMFSLAEGLPFAAMEAMTAGLPCVTSDRGGIPEAVMDGRTGFVRPLEDEAAIYDALACLVQDPERRRQMGAEARRYAVRQFSPVRLADEYEALYRALLAERPSSAPILPQAADMRSFL
jgi:glycosyltransferase involved in cell wall biosynthesis